MDDGRRDGTRDILRELCDGSERLRCIFHERNRGRGGAFKTGLAVSTGRVTGFLDVVTGLRIYRLSQTRGQSNVRLLHDSVEYLKPLHRLRGQVGLSLLGTSPLYWTGVGYDLAVSPGGGS